MSKNRTVNNEAAAVIVNWTEDEEGKLNLDLQVLMPDPNGDNSGISTGEDEAENLVMNANTALLGAKAIIKSLESEGESTRAAVHGTLEEDYEDEDDEVMSSEVISFFGD